jgi:hypothetical protein
MLDYSSNNKKIGKGNAMGKFLEKLKSRRMLPTRFMFAGFLLISLFLSFGEFLIVIMTASLDWPGWIENILVVMVYLFIGIPFIWWLYDQTEPVSSFPFATGHEANHKVKLITVHGTFAGDKSETGTAWWQLGSAFLQDLGERLDLDPSRVEVIPFQWELGPNSEATRRAAGEALYEYLKFSEDSQYANDYYLLGHSHGGSVIYSMLLHSIVKGSPLNRLKCWCTVGTPFLDYRRNRWLFQRLEGISLAVLTTGIVAPLLGLVVLTSAAFNANDIADDDYILKLVGISLMFYGFVSIAGLYAYEKIYKSWHSTAQKKKAAEEYSHSWLGLWHKEDEAIGALSNIKTLATPIVQKTFLQPFVRIALLLTVVGFGAYLAYDVTMNDADLMKELSENLMADFDLGFWTALGITGLTIVVFLLFAFIFSIIFSFWSVALGRPLANIINGFIWSSVRQLAWGDDLVKEDVSEVCSHPPEFVNKYGPIPDSVAAPLSSKIEKHAGGTLQKMRDKLGMAQNSDAVTSLNPDLSESLTGPELIHTSYFNVKEFVNLLALGLSQAGLGDLKEGFAKTTERDNLMAWIKDR